LSHSLVDENAVMQRCRAPHRLQCTRRARGYPTPFHLLVCRWLAALSLEDGYDLLDFLPDRGTQLIARLVNLGPVLLPDGRDLGLVVVTQVQLLEVRDPVGLPVTDSLRALLLQLLKLFLLTLGEDGLDLLHLLPDERNQLLGDGRHLLLLLIREV